LSLKERHLKRLMNEFVGYYQEGRTHLGVSKQTSSNRKATENTEVTARVASMPRLGGMHHRYDLAA
jgi:hypothetical protein